MYREGMSTREIAKVFGIGSHETVLKHLEKVGVERRPRIVAMKLSPRFKFENQRPSTKMGKYGVLVLTEEEKRELYAQAKIIRDKPKMKEWMATYHAEYRRKNILMELNYLGPTKCLVCDDPHPAYLFKQRTRNTKTGHCTAWYFHARHTLRQRPTELKFCWYPADLMKEASE